MAKIQAFLNINAFNNNAADVTNSIGELSSYARSYDPDVKIYRDDNTVLNIFRITESTPTEDGNLVGVFDTVAPLVDALHDAFDGSTDSLSIANTILMTDITVDGVGQDVLNPMSSTNAPEFIDFTYTGIAGLYEFRLWLCDASFRAGYPFCDFRVVSPIDLVDMDSFITDYDVARTVVEPLSTVDMLTRAMIVGAGTIITGYEAMELNVHDPDDYGTFYVSTWVLIYNGNLAAATRSARIAALRETVLGSSLFPLDDWETVIPGLIPLNRYYIIPTWANISVAAIPPGKPVQSVTIDRNAFDDVIADHFPAEPDIVVANELLRYSTAVYKSIGFMVLPDSENDEGRVDWYTKFQDYMPIDVNDVYVSSLSPLTQSCIRDMDELLRLADVHVQGGTVPALVTETLISQTGDLWLKKQTSSTELIVLTRGA